MCKVKKLSQSLRVYSQPDVSDIKVIATSLRVISIVFRALEDAP